MARSASTDIAIQADDMTLSFGELRALDGVSLAIAQGEVFGVLGPNGAGKPTSVRVLNGLLRPDRGHVRIGGLDPATAGDAVRARTGVLTESPSLYESMSGRDNLRFFGTLHGLAGAALDRRVAASLEAVGLSDRARDKAGTYSKGMKQRGRLVGERERNTLEALLYTPASDAEIFAGKTLASLLPAIAISWGSFALSSRVLNAVAWPYMGRAWFPTAAWWPLMGWVGPAVAALGMIATVIISARVKTYMEANQAAGILVLGVVALMASQATGVLLVTAPVALLIGAIVWLVDAALLLFAIRTFSRERLMKQL